VSARALRLLFAAALALVAGVGTAASDAEPAGRTPVPAIERATAGTQCVEDPAFMRRNHMTLLKHQRNETVHRGVRQARDSLQGCIACHASAKTGSVAQAKTDFCVGCHSYTAVQIDCFECHASKPQHGVAQTGAARP
jgi:predicted CXXCH cytochrome family protein